MKHLLNPEISRKTSFFFYRYRFFFIYIAIGVTSILLEILCYRGLEYFHFFPPVLANSVGLLVGIFFAYWMNVRFNFKVPSAKRNKAFTYFILISFGSATINFIFKQQLEKNGWAYGESRLMVSAVFFSLAYLLHRRFSFSDRKQVGVAIYANGVEDIKGIFQKIGHYLDFVHIDMIDHSFGEKDVDSTIYRLEVIQAYWPQKEVHIHMMSTKPLGWIEQTAKFADLIIIHYEIEEELQKVIEKIKDLNCKVGLCLTMDTPVEKARPYVKDLSMLMLLTISSPGRSGQAFESKALERIEKINQWPERKELDLCVDGGVNEYNIGLLNVEKVVSGSSVLINEQPMRQIMRLQTSSNYEKV